MTKTESPLGPPNTDVNKGGLVSREQRSDTRSTVPGETRRHRIRPVSEMAEFTDDVSGLNIPKSEHPDQFDLIWCTTSVFGQPTNDLLMKRERRGYEAVHAEDFEGRYAYLVRGQQSGPIVKDGMMLMARPTSWGEKAREEEKRKASGAVAQQTRSLQSGHVEGVRFLDGTRPGKVSKTVEPLDSEALRSTPLGQTP